MRKGFKEKYKWWATVELGRRVLLLLFIVPFPGNEVRNSYCILTVAMMSPIVPRHMCISLAIMQL